MKASAACGQNVRWIYDAEGQHAQKVVSAGSWTLYVHDAFGQFAATYNNIVVTPACATCYLTYDMLGSLRLIKDQTDSVIARPDFIPFGEEIPNTVAGRNGNFGYSSNVTQGFTGQESDGGSAGLDFDNARHFSAVMGSFMQPDPGNPWADFLRPQSWNAYSYVLRNPLGYTDPSGACDLVVGGLTQTQGSSSTREQEAFARSIGTISVVSIRPVLLILVIYWTAPFQLQILPPLQRSSSPPRSSMLLKVAATSMFMV